jgi:tetratricopeptide (TPR) repeat protein
VDPYRFAPLVATIIASVLVAAGQDAAEHARKAQQYLHDKQPELAIREYQAILDTDPGNVDAQGNLGVVLFFEQKYPEAAEHLRATLVLNPKLPKLQALLGMCEKRIGDTVKAQADLEAAFPAVEEKKLRVQTGLELIEIYYMQNQLDKAAEVVNVLRQLDPQNVEIVYTAHRIYSDLADETTLSLAMLAPDSARMHQLMAHELARQTKKEEAIAHYRAALKLEPARSDLHFELAEMLHTYSSASAQAEAEKEYQAALANNPFDEKSLCRLAEIAAKRSDLKSANDYFRRALELQPNDPDANLGLAKTLMAQHQPKEAETYLERAVRIEPFNPASHYRLGVLLRELGRADEAHREMAEFEKLKGMKSHLEKLYQEMRVAPAKQQSDSEASNE